jgi:hypothetical protein
MKGQVAKAIVLLVLCGASILVHADDSAAEIAAGGLQLRKEARISMEKERLTISENKITVEFEFLNETDQDITTEVAFPIPPYSAWDDEMDPRGAFNDFRVWVEGRGQSYQTEAKAKLKGADYTDVLRGMNVDIASFGHAGDLTVEPRSPDFQIPKLSKRDRDTLVRLGLLNKDDIPMWTVEKMYHWSQRFPAHEIVHIRHEYAPIEGFEMLEVSKIATDLKDACIKPGLQTRLETLVAENLKRQPAAGSYVYPTWIKYILKSANTWRMPIKGFELIVERAAPSNGHPAFVSFCWDGQVKKIDENHFSARKLNFVPADDLTIYYLWAVR